MVSTSESGPGRGLGPCVGVVSFFYLKSKVPVLWIPPMRPILKKCHQFGDTFGPATAEGERGDRQLHWGRWFV